MGSAVARTIAWGLRPFWQVAADLAIFCNAPVVACETVVVVNLLRPAETLGDLDRGVCNLKLSNRA